MTAEKIRIVKGGGWCLVVVDMKNDFVRPDGKLFVAGVEGEEKSNTVLINRIISLAAYPFDARVEVDENHVAGHIEFDKYGEHCLNGTFGQKIVDELIDYHKQADMIVVKGMIKNVYAFSITSSPEYLAHIMELRRRKIEHIVVVGLAFDVCVGGVAMAYAGQWFNVYVVRDCTRSVTEAGAKSMDERLKVCPGVKIVNFGDITGR